MALPNPFRWVGAVGYYYDDELGTYYVRARNYGVITGRWLSQDPLFYPLARRYGNETRLYYYSNRNLYEYVGSRPLVATDPTGENPVLLLAAVGFLYQSIAGVVCQIMFDNANLGADPGAQKRHCFTTCCLNRANALLTPWLIMQVGIAWELPDVIPSMLLGDHDRLRDSANDLVANAVGLLVSYNVTSTCANACAACPKPF